MPVVVFIYPLFFLVLFPITFFPHRLSCSLQKKYATSLSLIMATVGYSLVPLNEIDLVRYCQQIDQMRHVSILNILKNDKDFLYTRDIIFWLVGQTGHPQLVAYIVGFIFYWIAFYILLDQLERSKKKLSNIETIALFFIPLGTVPALSIISNVRCVLAFALVVFASYRDLVQSKRTFFTYILYVLPIGLHKAAIAFLFIRVLQGIVRYAKTPFLIGAVAFSWLVTFLYETIAKLALFKENTLFRIIFDFLQTAYTYLLWNEGGYATEIEKSSFNIVNRIYGVFYILFSFFMLLQYNRLVHNRCSSVQDIFSFPMVRFLFIVGIAAFGCLNIKTGAFWRFTAIFTVFSYIIFIPILKSDVCILKQQFKILSMSTLLVALIYGVWQIRQIDLEGTLQNFLSMSGFRIICDCLGLVM